MTSTWKRAAEAVGSKQGWYGPTVGKPCLSSPLFFLMSFYRRQFPAEDELWKSPIGHSVNGGVPFDHQWI